MYLVGYSESNTLPDIAGRKVAKMSSVQRSLYVVLCVGIAFSLYGCSGCGCGNGGGGKPPVEPNGPTNPPVQDPVETKQSELNNTEWAINITALADKNRKAEPDALRFVDKKVYSLRFESQGYARSNYTLRVKPNGTAIWETMQTKTGEGVLFWRGDWRDDKMTGVLTRIPKRGKKEEFYFVSTAVKKIEEAPSGE